MNKYMGWGSLRDHPIYRSNRIEDINTHTNRKRTLLIEIEIENETAILYIVWDDCCAVRVC